MTQALPASVLKRVSANASVTPSECEKQLDFEAESEKALLSECEKVARNLALMSKPEKAKPSASM